MLRKENTDVANIVTTNYGAVGGGQASESRLSQANGDGFTTVQKTMENNGRSDQKDIFLPAMTPDDAAETPMPDMETSNY